MNFKTFQMLQYLNYVAKIEDVSEDEFKYWLLDQAEMYGAERREFKASVDWGVLWGAYQKAIKSE